MAVDVGLAVGAFAAPDGVGAEVLVEGGHEILLGGGGDEAACGADVDDGGVEFVLEDFDEEEAVDPGAEGFDEVVGESWAVVFVGVKNAEVGRSVAASM